MQKVDIKRAQKNIKMAFEMYEFAYKVKFQALKVKYPDKSKDELHKLAVELIHKGCK